MRKWKPSRKAAAEYAAAAENVDAFVKCHPEIERSTRGDSFYFSVNGQAYRVSNHTVEASNAAAWTEDGEKKRDEYHPGGRREDTIYIFASPMRLIEIYNDLVAGYKLDGRGRRKK